MPTTTERGYGAAHKAKRRNLQALVDAGLAECSELACIEPDRWIRPGEAWDLAHDRANGPGAYLGPSHVRCNRSEGAKWRDQKSRSARSWVL